MELQWPQNPETRAEFRAPGKWWERGGRVHHLLSPGPRFKYIYFIFGCLGSSFLCEGFLLVVASGGHSSLRCAGLLPITASLVGEHRLQTRRLSSCGSRA